MLDRRHAVSGVALAVLLLLLLLPAGTIAALGEQQLLTVEEDTSLMPSAEEVAASRAAFDLRRAHAVATGGTSAWDAQLRAASEVQAATKRRAQEQGRAIFKYDVAALSGVHMDDISWSSAMTEPATTDCTDAAADNAGAAQELCRYSCAKLKALFLPGAPPAKTRCFLYDPVSQTWPESAPTEDGQVPGRSSELLSMRMQTQDWHRYLEPTSVFPAVFDVGEGDTCVNVTTQTMFPTELGTDPDVRVETRCLPPGHHQYNHTVDDVHSVEVVGYVNSTLQQGAGGTTPFVVGECIDTFIRISTTFASATVTWQLDDDGHNGPWEFTSPANLNSAQLNVYEHSSCMFDNRFTLTTVAGSDWEGHVEVVTKEDFENTIMIPNDESWIVQGVEGVETAGIPVQLQGRFESGRTFFEHGCDKHGVPDGHVNVSLYPLCTTESISTADLVVRHVRFSNQKAPLDLFGTRYTFSVVPGTSLGAVLRYTGGWGSTITFQHCVFDHLWATTGATFAIDGQMDEYARPPFHDPDKTPEDLRITIEISNCLIWAIDAPWHGVRVVDTYPANLTLANNQFIDNYGLVASAFNIGLFGGMFPSGFGVQGISYHSYIKNEIAAPHPVNGIGNGKIELGGITDYIYPEQWPVGPGTPRPDVATKILVEDLYCHDYAAWGGVCLLLFNRGNYNGGHFEVQIQDSEISNVTGAWASNAAGGSAVWLELDTVELTHTSFAHGGYERTRDTEEANLAEGGPLWALVTEFGRLESVSITDSGFTSRGGAVALQGTATFEIINCVFERNIAIADGGAVFFTGSGPLFIQDTIFLNNKVERLIEVPQQIVVNIFTGGTGAGQPIRPVWKLDGAPPDRHTGHCGNELVYGNSTYDREYEEGNLYAEVLTTTTGDHTLWIGAEVFKTSGFYSWVGGGWISITEIVSKTFPVLCDNRARIDCPAPNNFARDPGCYNGEDTGGGGDVQDRAFCPKGQAFWSSINFTVASGTGGAIAAVGTGAVTIRNSRFGSNQAGFGDALSATGSDRLIIQGTAFDAVSSNTISLEGVEPDGCRQQPCHAGERCTVNRLSLNCDQCPDGQVSADGIECEMCDPGKQHNLNHTACVDCSSGMYSSASTAGVCDPCSPGKQPANTRDLCSDCPPGSFSTYGSECTPCSAGHYSRAASAFCTECPAGQSSNSRIVCELCPSNSIRSQGQPECLPCDDGLEPDTTGQSCVQCAEPGHFSRSGQSCAPCSAGTQPFGNRTGCSPCPRGMTGIDGTCNLCQAGRYAESATQCSSCEAGMEPTEDRSGCQCEVGTYDSTSLGLITCDEAADPAIFQFGKCTECPRCLDCSVRGTVKLKEGWASFGSDGTVFSCPYQPACPERALNESSVSKQTCARGYSSASPLCSMCSDNYNAYKVGLVCDPCDDVTINVPLLMGVLAAGLGAVASVVTGAYAWLMDNGMMTDFRIMLGLYQILAQADTVLQMNFPHPVPELMAAVKLLFLDVRTLVHMDCFDMGGFYAKLATNIFAVPMLGVFACYVYYLNERKSVDRLIAEGITDETALSSAKLNLQRNLMIAVFLMYPMICTTLFSIPMCRQLNGFSFQESDYWVSCDTPEFSTLLFFSALGVLLVPIGIPLGFYLKMRAKVQELDGANENAAGGAKLVPEEADDQSDQFAFLCQDYKPEVWYWEPVSYFRKLLLNGLTVVIGRGTMGQIYFASIASAFFFAAHMRTYPFVVHKHNVAEAIGQATVLLMYSTCLLLRNGDEHVWADEWVNREAYGWMLVVLYVFICPSQLLYSLWVRLKREDQLPTDESQQSETVNPLGDGAEGLAQRTAEQRVRMAKLQQRKARSLATELTQAKAVAVKAQKELAEMKANAARQPSDTTDGVAYSLDTRRASQVNALSGLIGDKLVDEEIVQKAQQRFAKHVLYEIERPDSLQEFLTSPDVRLAKHFPALVAVGGTEMVADDVQYLTDAEIAEVAERSQMTKMEARRFASVVKRERAKHHHQPSEHIPSDQALFETEK